MRDRGLDGGAGREARIAAGDGAVDVEQPVVAGDRARRQQGAAKRQIAGDVDEVIQRAADGARRAEFEQAGRACPEGEITGDGQLARLLPADSVPLTMVLPSVPLPPIVAPASTVVPDDEAIEPFTSSLPPLTVVAPV